LLNSSKVLLKNAMNNSILEILCPGEPWLVWDATKKELGGCFVDLVLVSGSQALQLVLCFGFVVAGYFRPARCIANAGNVAAFVLCTLSKLGVSSQKRP
jgi:hypothetical protein